MGRWALLVLLVGCGHADSDSGPIDSDTPPDTDVTPDTDTDTDTCTPTTWYPDQDGDGYGSTVDAVSACDAPDDGLTWLPVAGDCDDNAAAISPDAQEVCDADDRDEDCDGAIDDDDDTTTGQTPWYRDADGDGYGDELDHNPAMYCTFPTPSRVENNDDCDDGDPEIHPGAVEVENHVDDNCDGNADEGV